MDRFPLPLLRTFCAFSIFLNHIRRRRPEVSTLRSVVVVLVVAFAPSRARVDFPPLIYRLPAQASYRRFFAAPRQEGDFLPIFSLELVSQVAASPSSARMSCAKMEMGRPLGRARCGCGVAQNSQISRNRKQFRKLGWFSSLLLSRGSASINPS